MIRRLFLALLLVCASVRAIACPLCLGAYQSSRADQLVEFSHAVLVVPAGNGYRVVDVIKGGVP
jgi:hypothetical protein